MSVGHPLTSRLWLHRTFREFVCDRDRQSFDTDYCMWLCDYKKPTTIKENYDLDAIALRCDGNHQHATWKSRSHSGSAYPSHTCAAWAKCLNRWAETSAVVSAQGREMFFRDSQKSEIARPSDASGFRSRSGNPVRRPMGKVGVETGTTGRLAVARNRPLVGPKTALAFVVFSLAFGAHRGGVHKSTSSAKCSTLRDSGD